MNADTFTISVIMAILDTDELMYHPDAHKVDPNFHIHCCC